MSLKSFLKSAALVAILTIATLLGLDLMKGLGLNNWWTPDFLLCTALSGLFGGTLFELAFHFVVPASKRMSFTPAVLLQTFAFFASTWLLIGFAITIIDYLHSEYRLLDLELWSRGVRRLRSTEVLVVLGASSLFGAGFLSVRQVSRKLGPRNLWRWIVGGYHRPREEPAVIMFLDLDKSTALSEVLSGPEYARLLQSFFSDLDEVLERTGGTVSHHIGDGAVILWSQRKGLRRANCIRFFFELRARIAKRADSYAREFGHLPSFKAGIHIGNVVASEVGGRKSEIVYSGMAMNVTARVTQACGEAGVGILVSAPLAEALQGRSLAFAFKSIGVSHLKGVSDPMELFGVVEQSSLPT